jgi:ribosomal protein S24E
LAVLLKAELDQVWVRSIETKTGTHMTVGLAHVYNDPGKALVVEPGYIIQRNQKPEKTPEAEEPEAEEPPAEEKDAEKPEAEEPSAEEEEAPEAEEPAVEEEAEEQDA